MKHAYLITDTAYKMLNQASFLDIMYKYDIRRNVKNQNTDLSYIEIWKMSFDNLSPNINTDDFVCVADITCRGSTQVACWKKLTIKSSKFNRYSCMRAYLWKYSTLTHLLNPNTPLLGYNII